MELETRRDIDEDLITARLIITADDLAAAFAADDQASHDLFYAVFSRKYEKGPISGRMLLLAEVARRAEGARALNLAAEAVPKEGL